MTVRTGEWAICFVFGRLAGLLCPLLLHLMGELKYSQTLLH